MFANCSANDSANCSGSDEDPFFGFLGPPPLIVEFAKVLYGLVGAVGLCGNTLVIYVVLRFSKMQTVTNTYLLNLALADEMFLSGLPFLLTTMSHSAGWPFGLVACKMYMTSTSINQFTGSLLLTVMSADRYVAVCHPIRSPRYRTPVVAKSVCLTAWALSALLMVPVYMYSGVLRAGPYVSCNVLWPEYDGVLALNGEAAFALYAFALGFAVPLVLILVFYFLVICRLRRARGVCGGGNRERRHRRVTQLVLTVVTVYVVCWLPYWCAQLWLTFAASPDSGQGELGFALMLATGCLSYANSAVNPLLYAFLSDNFRKSFAKAFACAAGRDLEAQLHGENSVFPPSRRKGERTESTAPLTVAKNGPKQLQQQETHV